MTAVLGACITSFLHNYKLEKNDVHMYMCGDFIADVVPFILLTLFVQLLVSVGLEDYHLIAVWNWRKGRVLATVRGHTDRVSSQIIMQ